MFKLKNIENGKAELTIVTVVAECVINKLFHASNAKRKENLEKDLNVEIRYSENDRTGFLNLEVVKVIGSENDLDKTADLLMKAQTVILREIVTWENPEDQTQQDEPHKMPELVKKVMDMMREKKYIIIMEEDDRFNVLGNIHALTAIKVLLTTIVDHEDA